MTGARLFCSVSKLAGHLLLFLRSDPYVDKVIHIFSGLINHWKTITCTLKMARAFDLIHAV